MNYNWKLRKCERKYLVNKRKGFIEIGKFVDKSVHELYEFYQRMGCRIRCVVGMREATAMFYKMVPEFPVSLTPYEQEELVDWEAFDKTDAILVIGSSISSRRVERRFWNKNLKCAILNIYDYFYLRGYELYADFWKYSFYGGFSRQGLKDIFKAYLRQRYYNYGLWHIVLNLFPISEQLANNAIWSRTFCLRKAYASQQGNEDMHVMYLQRFIYECVKGRDYLTAKKYVQEYCCKNYKDADDYQKFLRAWEELLEKIKNRIQNRTKEDVVVNWLDAVSRRRIIHMPYLLELAQNNVQFLNAYTNTPWTSWCMKSIFAGVGAIEGRLYRFKKITCKNFRLMREIKKQNYRFFYIGPRIIQKKVFFNRDCGCSEMREHEISFSYYYWRMLCLLSVSKRKLFLLVHELYATHPPYFSPELELFEEDAELADVGQRKKSCEYMDAQMRWWDSFLNGKICRLYMGDHGDHVDPENKTNFDYVGSRTNVLFIIKNKQKNWENVDRFFPLKNMEKLLDYILGWNKLNAAQIFSNDICIEEYDRYNRDIVAGILNAVDDDRHDYRKWMQFRALRTSTDVLVRYANGKEWYFKLPDEEKNCIEEEDDQKRIQELRVRLGENFINVWEEDFFVNSRKLYLELNEDTLYERKK